jgi:hypothetical protein
VAQGDRQFRVVGGTDHAGNGGEGLPPPGGGGTYDDMLEERVARLEDDMKEVRADLKAIREDVSYLRGKVDTLPTTLHLLAFATAVLVAAGVFRWIGG